MKKRKMTKTIKSADKGLEKEESDDLRRALGLQKVDSDIRSERQGEKTSRKGRKGCVDEDEGSL